MVLLPGVCVYALVYLMKTMREYSLTEIVFSLVTYKSWWITCFVRL